jgi:spermidine/putrescine transport system substrate-binding protein
MNRYGITLLLLLFCQSLMANRIVNVYIWGGEVPKEILQKFEQTTGIHVNFSTYDSNETLYAKLKANDRPTYDVILPSSYYVERLKRQGMLTQLDYTQLDNAQHIDPVFTNNAYDPMNTYSVPLLWGATGIFYSQNQTNPALTSWRQFWEPRYKNSLLLLDDAREVFAIALMSLGYLPNDGDPQHIQQAYEKLIKLTPNIKLFSSEGIQALLIDEDAKIGMVWNGDAYKAHKENNAIHFIFPKEGFVIWVDCLAIPSNAPHTHEAYEFINFLLRPEIAKEIGLTQGHAITNKTGKALLPAEIRNNEMIYPPANVLTSGYFQRDPGDKAVALYNEYWQKLKLAP